MCGLCSLYITIEPDFDFENFSSSSPDIRFSSTQFPLHKCLFILEQINLPDTTINLFARTELTLPQGKLSRKGVFSFFVLDMVVSHSQTYTLL